MRRAVALAVLVAVVVAGVGMYGTFGLSGTAADRSITVDVVDQSDGIVGIDADYSVETTGNETRLATVTNRGARTFHIAESVDGTTRTYSLDPSERTDVVVDVDCNATTGGIYEIDLDAETDEPEGNIRIESTTTVGVRCVG